MTATLQDAIAAVRAGETERAQLLAAEVIRDNPDDANAWYLLSQLVDSDARRTIYLHKALALDPEHSRARAEFDALPAAAVVSLSGAPAAGPVVAEIVEAEPVAIELGEAEPVELWPVEVEEVAAPTDIGVATDFDVAMETLGESEATPTETTPEWLRPLSPEPVAAAESAPAPVVATPHSAPAPAPARPRKTPPPPPPRRGGNGALTALLVILLLLTLAVLAVLAYLLLM